MKNNRSEQGQTLILLAIGFVVFLGFVALALDGGMAYSDRRTAQNAADASGLAGAGAAALSIENSHVFYSTWSCADGRLSSAQSDAITAAIARAGDNDFIIDGNRADLNGVTTQCGIDTANGITDKFIDITVEISSTTHTNFIQVFYGGEIRNHVVAVTRVRPRSPLVFGNAVVALNPANCQGQQNGAGFHGSNTVNVKGGGIFSNGCIRADGGPNINVTDGGVNGRYIDDGDQFNPDAQQTDAQIPPSTYDVPAPNCAGKTMSASALSGNNVNLTPGLHCINGNAKLNAKDKLVGHDVTLYFVDGGLTINGGATVQLDAPEQTPDPAPAIPGIVIMLPASNHSDIQINGNSDSFFEGTILAPGSNIDMTGNGSTDAFRAQVIGWNVEVGGTADTNVIFSEDRMYSKPTTIELYE